MLRHFRGCCLRTMPPLARSVGSCVALVIPTVTVARPTLNTSPLLQVPLLAENSELKLTLPFRADCSTLPLARAIALLIGLYCTRVPFRPALTGIRCEAHAPQSLA